MQRVILIETSHHLEESVEENYGHEGDISALLSRSARQRRLDEAVRSVPETD